MFKRPCKRQRFQKQQNAYGENHRRKLGKGSFSIRAEHENMIAYIAVRTGSSKSCVLETIIRRVLLSAKVRPLEILRRTAIPFDDRKNNLIKYTISKELLFFIKELAIENETKFSVAIWHLLTIFQLELCPMHLFLEEYLGS